MCQATGQRTAQRGIDRSRWGFGGQQHALHVLRPVTQRHENSETTPGRRLAGTVSSKTVSDCHPLTAWVIQTTCCNWPYKQDGSWSLPRIPNTHTNSSGRL